MSSKFSSPFMAKSPLNSGGGLGKLVKTFASAAKQYGKKLIGKSKKKPQDPPVSNFKQFHRDGVTYDTKSINQEFINRFGPPKPKSSKPTDGWGMTGDEPLSKNPHWLGDADPRWDPIKQMPQAKYDRFDLRPPAQAKKRVDR